MGKYRAIGEDIEKDKRDFYSQGGGKIDRYPALDPNRIIRCWALLLEEQNGPNFDDYVMGDSHKIERYLEHWCPPPAKILLLGTGTGREVYAAREHGYDAEGTTLGKENLPFAKWKFDLDLEYADNCTLPYPDKSFDVIAGFQVFEHCHAPYLFLIECCRILKGGGLLILEWPPFMATADGTVTPNPGQMHDFMGDYDDDNIHHMCCWTPAQGRIMTRRCGFEDVEVYMSGYGSGGNAETIQNAPNNLSLLTEKDPAFYSNVGSGDIVLKATRRIDKNQPGYMKKMLVVTV